MLIYKDVGLWNPCGGCEASILLQWVLKLVDPGNEPSISCVASSAIIFYAIGPVCRLLYPPIAPARGSNRPLKRTTLNRPFSETAANGRAGSSVVFHKDQTSEKQIASQRRRIPSKSATFVWKKRPMVNIVPSMN